MQRIRYHLQVSVLVVANMTADCIVSLCFDLTNAFDIFPYSLLFNCAIVFSKQFTHIQVSCQGFGIFCFYYYTMKTWCPSWLYLTDITVDINALCISVCNSSLVLFAGHLKFFRNTRNVKDWKLLKFHFDDAQNRGLDKGMKQNVYKTTFTLFTLKTKGIHFACKLDNTNITRCQCVKDIGSL